MVEGNSFNLFFGQIPGDEFVDDLSEIKSLKENEVLELIDLIIKGYPKKDIEKDWEEWSKNFTKEEEEKKKKIIGILIFIFKELVSEKINEIELKEDFNKLNLPLSYIDYFIKKLESSREFKNKASRGKKPYENYLRNIDWRIDERKFNDETKDTVAVIEFVYASKGEKGIVQLDFNSKSLKHLISLLSKIEKRLCQNQ